MMIRISDIMIFTAILSFVTIDLSIVGLLQKFILRVLLVGFSAWVWLMHPVQNLRINKIRFLYATMVSLVSISTLWSSDPSKNILHAIDLIVYVFFISSYFIRFSYFSDWDMQLSFVNGVSYFLLFFLVLAIFNPSQFVHFDRTGFFRLGGHSINSNFLSVLCTIPIGFYLFSDKKGPFLRFLVHFLIPTALLFLSGSRAPTFLFLISILLLILRSNNLHLVLASLLLFVSALIVSFEFLVLQFRLTSISDLVTLTGRTEIWRDLLANVTGTTVLIGHGAFGVSSVVDGEPAVLNGHNSFLNALLFAGVGALTLHFILTFSLLKFCNRIYFLYPPRLIGGNIKFLFTFLIVILGMQMVEGALVGRNSVLLFLSGWVIWFISRRQYEENYP